MTRQEGRAIRQRVSKAVWKKLGYQASIMWISDLVVREVRRALKEERKNRGWLSTSLGVRK